jgi:DNA-binding winged helix-turn-helix (wHTH) protein
MIDQDVYLTIQHGETETKNNIIPITNRETFLGRKWGENVPEVPFMSPYISRKHAVIGMENENFFIVDLISKHGTQVNHTCIENNNPFSLRDGDIISLAKGAAILTFHNTVEKNLGNTLELPSIQDESQEELTGLNVNMGRREILIDGVQIYLGSKDTELFWLLYQNVNYAVSYEQIKVNIWPERFLNDAVKLEVGREEMNTLVYRLRKKLGKYGQNIISVPRYGYMLDLKNSL